MKMKKALCVAMALTITFAAIECDLGVESDCIGGRGGTVQLEHAGNTGSEVNVATGTAAEIEASFAALADASYGGLSATVELVNTTHVSNDFCSCNSCGKPCRL